MARRLAGWTWNGDQLVEEKTVAGALVRALSLKGTCRLAPECRRHVDVDFRALSHIGLALYQSVAAAPIFKPAERGELDDAESESVRPSIFGVVIGTSDVPYRYLSDDAETTAPIQALAEAVAMVLIAANFSRSLAVEVGDARGTDSGDAP